MLDGCVKVASFSIALGPHIAGALLLLFRSSGEVPRAASTVNHDTVQSATISNVIYREDAPKSRPAKPARTLTMRLESGEPVPDGRPNTWVHIPKGLAPSELMLTFVFHGFKNCIDSYTSAGIQCTSRNIKRPGYEVAAQLERAGSRSIVVVPETSFDIFNAEAPNLSKHGAFRVYVEELLAVLADETGGAHIEDVHRVALAASSGGYLALEPILQDNPAMVTDVLLLDAGYMYQNSAVGHYLGMCATELAHGTPTHHVGILYTPSGGALPTSEELLRLTRNRLAHLGALEAGRFGHVRHGDPSLEDLAAPLYVLRVDQEHDVVVRRNLGRVIAAAGL